MQMVCNFGLLCSPGSRVSHLASRAEEKNLHTMEISKRKETIDETDFIFADGGDFGPFGRMQ